MGTERPLVFDCAGDQLVGILHEGKAGATTGVVIVVGGPQYRVGSHRQFVVMARSIARAGYPVFRFDYRGMGDSEGQSRPFDVVDDDVRTVVDAYTENVPTLDNIVLLGLCDAASASLIYAAKDRRVTGLVLLNPWVRTEQGAAKSYLRHYYLQRMLSKSFWRKVFSGEFQIGRSVREFLRSVNVARRTRSGSLDSSISVEQPFFARMLSGFESFRYPVLVLISGRDLTASEFIDLCAADRAWGKSLGRENVRVEHFPDADHTMSSKEHLDEATARCVSWLDEHFP